MVANTNKTPLLWLAFATLYVVWGSTYLAIRFALVSLPPFFMAGARFLTAGLALYLWRRWAGSPRPRAKEWKSATVGGFLLLALGNGGVVWAERTVTSGTAALLVGTVPLWMSLAEAVVDRRWPRLGVSAGLALGFVGTLLLVGPAAGQVSVSFGVWLVLGAALAWAIGSIFLRRAPLPADKLQAAAMEMMAGGGVLFAASLLSGEVNAFRFDDVTSGSLWALAYLIGMGSIVGFSVYVWLLHETSVAQVSTYAYVNPVIAVLLGAWLAGEPLTWRIAVAGIVILSGVGMVLRFGRFKEAKNGTDYTAVHPEKDR
jgi:drug/metabolite transporter (DMT)-like permease